MIVTAGTLEESREALELAKAHPNLYSTVGVHPTRCSEFFGGATNGGGDPEAHMEALMAVLQEGKALGKVRGYCGPWLRGKTVRMAAVLVSFFMCACEKYDETAQFTHLWTTP